MILSAVAGFGLSLTGVIAQAAAFGCGAAVNAILMVFYLFNRSAPIMLFPIPIQIPVKWIVLFTGGIETAYLLLHHFDLFDFVLLLGLGAGYVWYSLFLTRRSTLQISERYFALRNSYYRWKRRRAARNSKSICATTIAPSPSTSTAITFPPKKIRKMATQIRGG